MPAKRLLDIVGAITALILLMPLLLVLMLLVRLRLGSPIFFTQIRPGRAGRPFRLVKFRSMHDAVDSDGHHLPDAERMSTFGRWLRSTSLDELPELWNVLRGDMSLVGPRPLLMEYLDHYTPEQARRHEVRPGLTGWAQIHGRNELTWEERFLLDVWYVDNRTLWLDVKILWKTVYKVVGRDGINQRGHVTMTPFRSRETRR